MAKKASKAKAKAKSSKKKVAKKKPGGKAFTAKALTGAPPLVAMVAVDHPALADAKRAAVVSSVNGFLDQNRPGWNADLHGNGRTMAGDLKFPANSIPVVLGDIRNRLQPKHFTFTITPGLVQTSATGTVANMKFAIFQAATTL